MLNNKVEAELDKMRNENTTRAIESQITANTTCSYCLLPSHTITNCQQYLAGKPPTQPNQQNSQTVLNVQPSPQQPIPAQIAQPNVQATQQPQNQVQMPPQVQNQQYNPQQAIRRCYNCGDPSHLRFECPLPPRQNYNNRGGYQNNRGRGGYRGGQRGGYGGYGRGSYQNNQGSYDQGRNSYQQNDPMMNNALQGMMQNLMNQFTYPVTTQQDVNRGLLGQPLIMMQQPQSGNNMPQMNTPMQQFPNQMQQTMPMQQNQMPMQQNQGGFTNQQQNTQPKNSM